MSCAANVTYVHVHTRFYPPAVSFPSVSLTQMACFEVQAAQFVELTSIPSPNKLRRFGSIKPARLSIAKGCMEDGCDRRPRYGYKDSKKPAYCARHRHVLETMYCCCR